MDYTPTTEEVCQLWMLQDKKTVLNHQRGIEFDRWLAEVKAEQDKATTDRIIALLTPPDYEKCECHLWQSDCLFCRTTLPEVIALIKGEN